MADETKVADVLVEDGQPVNAEETVPAVSKDGEEADPQATPKSGEELEDGKPKRKGGWLRKLERSEREKEFWRDQALANRSQPAKETAKEETDKGPLLDDYIAKSKTYEQWADDRFQWNESKKQAETSKANEQQRSETIVRSYRERLGEFIEEHDDFNDVVGQANFDNEVAPAVQSSLMEDENGPALAYYLGQHPEIVDHINSLSAIGAARYVGRLAERLFPETTEEDEQETPELVVTPRTPKPAVSAPAPLKPVKKPAPTATGLNDDLSTEEWMRRREKQIRK